MRKLGLSRRELFENIERGVLNDLPAEDWEFAEWRRARVNPARALARRPIITSRSMTSSIRFRTRSFANKWMRASPRARSRSSIAASASGSINAATWARQARRGPRPHAQFPPALRRVDAGSVPTLGRQNRAEHASADHRRARQPAASPRGLAPAWGFCAPIAGSTPTTSRRSRPAPSNWASSTARASPRSSPASSTRRARTPAPSRSSTTPTCAVAATTTDRKSPCSLISRRMRGIRPPRSTN